MPKKLTTGQPLKQILLFCLPLLLGNLFQQAYNAADAAIVGKTLGNNALAAVGATGSVQFLVFGFCLGTCSGFSIPVASAYGSNNKLRLRKNIFHSGFLTFVLAIIITIVASLSTTHILNILQVPLSIYNDAYNYLLIIFLGIPFTLLYNYLSGLLRAVGDSKTPFYILAFTSLINIALDFYFILGLNLGVAGAAIATIIAQALAGFYCLIYIYKKEPRLAISKDDWHLEKETTYYILNMGLPMGLQFSITAIGTMIMQSSTNALGKDYVAGYAAGCKVNQFFASPFDCLAAGVCTFVAQNQGAKIIKRVKAGIKIGILLAIIWGLIGGSVLIFASSNLVKLFLEEKASLLAYQTAIKYLFWLGLFYTLLGLIIIVRLITQGLGLSKQALLAGVLETLARAFVSFVFVPKYGFLAVCLTDQAAWLVADIYIIPMCYFAYQKVKKEITNANKKIT